MLDLKRTTWNFFSGIQLTFGPNAVNTLAGVIQRYEVRQALLITDKMLEEVGAVQQAQRAICQTSATVHLLAESETIPSTDTIERYAEVARECNPDLVIALGGGSVIDVAKSVCAVISHDIRAESLPGVNTISGPTTRLVCIPTTAGTGSEISHSAVLKSSASGETSDAISPFLRPDIAIVDPYMTLSCPATLTATSGFEALSHAIEASAAANFFNIAETANEPTAFEGNNPFGDMYAEKAIRLIAQHLRKAVDEPENLAARSGMSLAATLAGAAFSNCGGGLCRAFSHAIRSTEHCSHGIGTALMLPEVVRYLAQHRPAKVASIAAWLDDSFVGLPHDEAANAAINFICQLRADVGLPSSLNEVGINESHLAKLAEQAFRQQRLIDLAPGSPNIDDGHTILKACR